MVRSNAVAMVMETLYSQRQRISIRRWGGSHLAKSAAALAALTKEDCYSLSS